MTDAERHLDAALRAAVFHRTRLMRRGAQLQQELAPGALRTRSSQEVDRQVQRLRRNITRGLWVRRWPIIAGLTLGIGVALLHPVKRLQRRFNRAADAALADAATVAAADAPCCPAVSVEPPQADAPPETADISSRLERRAVGQPLTLLSGALAIGAFLGAVVPANGMATNHIE